MEENAISHLHAADQGSPILSNWPQNSSGGWNRDFSSPTLNLLHQPHFGDDKVEKIPFMFNLKVTCRLQNVEKRLMIKERCL